MSEITEFYGKTPSIELINTCPNCGYEQKCGCKHCQANFPLKGHKPYKWVDGTSIKCAKCGITEHCDWWLMWEMECANL